MKGFQNGKAASRLSQESVAKSRASSGSEEQSGPWQCCREYSIIQKWISMVYLQWFAMKWHEALDMECADVHERMACHPEIEYS